VVIDAGDAALPYRIAATKASPRVEVSSGRTVVEVTGERGPVRPETPQFEW
jgi:hypothetical protein